MIIKIVRAYHPNGTTKSQKFSEENEFPFKERATKFSDGSQIVETYYEPKDMQNMTNLIKKNWFDTYTEYATFLIAYEAKFKAVEK